MSPVCWCSAARAGAAPGQSCSGTGIIAVFGSPKSRQRVPAPQEIPSPPEPSLSLTMMSPGCPGHQEPGWHGQGRAAGLFPCEQHTGDLLEQSKSTIANTCCSTLCMGSCSQHSRAPHCNSGLVAPFSCAGSFHSPDHHWCPSQKREPPPASPLPLLGPSHG